MEKAPNSTKIEKSSAEYGLQNQDQNNDDSS